MVAYAPTDQADEETKCEFYGGIEDCLERAAKGDSILTLGDFNAVTGRESMPNDRVLGTYGSGVVNNNSERMCTRL